MVSTSEYYSNNTNCLLQKCKFALSLLEIRFLHPHSLNTPSRPFSTIIMAIIQKASIFKITISLSFKITWNLLLLLFNARVEAKRAGLAQVLFRLFDNRIQNEITARLQKSNAFSGFLKDWMKLQLWVWQPHCGCSKISPSWVWSGTIVFFFRFEKQSCCFDWKNDFCCPAWHISLRNGFLSYQLKPLFSTFAKLGDFLSWRRSLFITILIIILRRQFQELKAGWTQPILFLRQKSPQSTSLASAWSNLKTLEETRNLKSLVGHKKAKVLPDRKKVKTLDTLSKVKTHAIWEQKTILDWPKQVKMPLPWQIHAQGMFPPKPVKTWDLPEPIQVKTWSWQEVTQVKVCPELCPGEVCQVTICPGEGCSVTICPGVQDTSVTLCPEDLASLVKAGLCNLDRGRGW